MAREARRGVVGVEWEEDEMEVVEEEEEEAVRWRASGLLGRCLEGVCGGVVVVLLVGLRGGRPSAVVEYHFVACWARLQRVM